MKKLASRWLRYVQRFGMRGGLRLAVAIERAQSDDRDSRVAYRVPGFNAPVQLRRTVSDHAIFCQCLVMRQYDIDRFPHSQRLDEVYRAEIAAGRLPLIVDCGANIGLSALFFAQRFPGARIVAVEPDARNFEMLQANTMHLGDRIRCVRGGVWPVTTPLKIENPDSGSAAFRVRPAQAGDDDTVDAYSIDDLCRHGGGVLLAVKLDIEGSQASLFQANTDWVAEAHLITLELDDWLMPWAGTSRSFSLALAAIPLNTCSAERASFVSGTRRHESPLSLPNIRCL